MNRLTELFKRQAFGFLAAVAAARVRRTVHPPDRLTQWAGRLPFWLSGGFFAILIVLFLGMMIWARLGG